jgi:RHS repeat-associated protein
MMGWQWTGGNSNSMTFQSGRMNVPETPQISMFRNRAYDSRTGRWLQEDPIGVAGGLNLYQFNGNNPINFSDPFGLCPGGAKDGTICIDFFIKAASKWGFRGDNRGHNPNAPPSKSRAQILVDPSNANATTYTVTESCFGNKCSPSSGSNRVYSYAPEDGKGVTITFHLKDAAAPFGASPDLNGVIFIRPDGKGGVTTAGDVSAYPSSDIYQRQGGQWVPIRAPHEETTPLDLIDELGHDKW